MLKGFKTNLSNRLLILLFYPAWRSFWNKSAKSGKIQTDYLLKTLKTNAKTQFGKNHSFDAIHSITDFQKYVPISNYENYIEYIEEIKIGRKSVLTNDAVKKFSFSSGSASASKLIPNTQALINEFDRCISIWLFDLYKRFPRLLNGRSFWIITPSTKTTNQESKINQGFDNDSEYFLPLKQWFIRNIFAVPDEVAQFCQGENYYFVLALFLVSEKNLRLISLWNPSVLIILLEKISSYQTQIIETIETGQLVVPEPMDKSRLLILEKLLKRNPKRALELKMIFDSTNEKSEIWSAIWPDLILISAWDSSWANTPANQIRRLFPKVAFQGKGLLATEACVTFPAYVNSRDFQYFPAFTSHFFEFENTVSKEIRLLHQLETNCTYEVIVTTAGGFYRYRLNDLVTCTSYSNCLPILHFMGKNNQISDIMGEKLHESHVEQVLLKAFTELQIESTFYFLAPEITEESIFYCLFIQSTNTLDFAKLQQLVENGLCENFHYKHCRTLQQLSEIEIHKLDEDSFLRFYSIIQSNSQVGSFKQSALRKETFWKSKLIQ